MFNPVDKAITFIHDHRPKQVSRYVMPYLVVVMTALLVLDLFLVADTRDEGAETRTLTNETRQLAKKVERIAKETRHFTKALRDGIVQSCEKNGNPVRRAVRRMIQTEINRASQVDYTKLFPDFPPDELAKLIRRQVRDQKQTISELKEVDCQEQYPATPKEHPAGR